MPEPTPRLTPMPTVSRDALRIVLFGLPDAGKSSLLGALAQASQTQEHVLNGHLTDLAQGLAELQRRLYDGTPRETLEEVVPYPVAFEPFAQPHDDHPRRLDVVLVDCDGRAANDLLARRRALEDDGTGGTLAQAILQADALILAVDASASPAQNEADFVEFARFLRLFQQSRGRRTEVSGLPIFLVLTKCDLLAQPQDSIVHWIERIEERKRQVGHRFQDFLAERNRDRAVPFGSIELHLWATAIKHPALSDSPAKPGEPYGVAELFRQCLDQARRYRVRRRHSDRRLFWTVTATMGVLVVLAALALGLVAYHREGEAGPLETQVHEYRMNETEQSRAASHQHVQAQIDQLQAFVNDPHFAALSHEDQQYTRQRLQELTDYQAFEKKLNAIPPPSDARSEEQLKKIRASLAAITVPPAYQQEWQDTKAGQQRTNWQEDADALATAVQRTKAAYQELIREGQTMLDRLNDLKVAEAARRAREILDKARELPQPKDARSRTVPGSRRVTYDSVFAFDSVQDVYDQWKEIKKRLARFAQP